MRELRNYALGYCLLFGAIIAAAPPRNAWVASWATSPTPADPNPKAPLLHIENQTVRERVRLGVGGAQICLRLSNEYGITPLLIGSVTVGTAKNSSSVRPDSVQTVTFGGRNSVTIPTGAPVLSDPVEFPVSSGAEVSISIYFPNRVSTPTIHALALKQAVVSDQGDHTREEKIDGKATSRSSILVSAVLVPAQSSQRLIVAFGDSLIDGDGSTVDADRNWPTDLARRLAKTPEGSNLAVVNAGIAGNRLLSEGALPSFGASALARFDRDALAAPGVTHVVLLEGLNDIGLPGASLGASDTAQRADIRTPKELIDAYCQLSSRAHARGVKLIGATITPFEGADIPGYYSDSKEKIRQTLNNWIRSSDSFDGVIDFDAVVRDPEHPTRLLPKFASKDRLHPNDAGYQAMADAIDLALFK